MVHRVIDLTRPEDLDGKHLCCLYLLLFLCLFLPPFFIFFQQSFLGFTHFSDFCTPHFCSFIILMIQKCRQMHKGRDNKCQRKARGRLEEGRSCRSFEKHSLSQKQSHPVQTKLMPVTLNFVGPTQKRPYFWGSRISELHNKGKGSLQTARTCRYSANTNIYCAPQEATVKDTLNS